jgi:hypothetical protein
MDGQVDGMSGWARRGTAGRTGEDTLAEGGAGRVGDELGVVG